ncbi:uncharacterized protein FIBRA_08226 [Fibroporia radiculosa]|uniref:Uncharacterized protein n=1 Tax=Fibroporia radiculosa TaxID=599839 RepID=J4GWF1_9APHY|nr:uncharacterized protein FIBRA_08226 [Fibroporia radiculosa]CCM05985.1 predicted protein [Fibroporia radiculosa]
MPALTLEMTISFAFGTEAKTAGHGARGRSDDREFVLFEAFLQVGRFKTSSTLVHLLLSMNKFSPYRLSCGQYYSKILDVL